MSLNTESTAVIEPSCDWISGLISTSDTCGHSAMIREIADVYWANSSLFSAG